MRSFGAPAVTVGALLASACTLVTSLDGLSSGSGDDGGTAPMHDSSTAAEGGDAPNADDRSVDDAPADAPDGLVWPLDSAMGRDAARDTSSPSDGPAESGPPTDAAHGPGDSATTFCASLSPQPLFCEDFDEGSYTAGWSYLHTMGGSLALDGTEFRSSPDAMIAQSGIAGSGLLDVAGYRSFALAGTSMFTGTVEFDFRVDQTDASGGLAVLAQLGLLDGAGGGQYFVQFVAHSQGATPLGLSVNEAYFSTGKATPTVTHAVTPTIALGTWTHVALSVAAPYGGGAGTATLSFDGAQVESSSISVPVKNFSQIVGVGLTFVKTPSNGWTAVYDNVTFAGTGL